MKIFNKKTLLAVLMIAVMMISVLVACSSPADDTKAPTDTTTAPTGTPNETTADPEGEKEPEEEKNSPFKTVEKPNNCTFEMVFKAPEGNKRQIVLDYMRKMAEIEWTPAVDFTTTHAPGEERDYTVQLEYKAGKKYYGVPYANTKADYYQFQEYLDGNTFSCDNYYYNYIIGNHCSSSMFLAYQQIIPVGYGTLRPSTARKGIFKLCGDLKNPGDGTWYSKDCFELNGQEAVFEAYTTMDAGDILFKCISGSGHTRMVSKVEVTRNAGGKLIPSRCFAYVIEQTNAWYDANRNSTWWVDKKYAFPDLYNKEFMPITLDSYFDDSEITDACIWFTGNNKAEDLTTKITGTVSSNYPINYVLIKIEDTNGNIVKKNNLNNLSECTSVDLYREMFYDLKMSDLPAGSYKYTLTAGIARGNCTIETIDFTVA